MALAKTYSPNPQAQKNQDVGPTPYQQMSSAFVGAATGPQLKAFQYTVLSAVKGAPVIGNLYHGFEYLTDPIGELKKDLNISPTISGSIGEAIVSHSVAGAVKVFAVGLGAASTGQISNSLVQNAIAYEWANQAVLAKRNPAKFIVQTVWNNLIKGDILDHFIYDKTYLFYKAENEAGERFARWRNNGLFEDFNRRAEKYGVKLEGAEQKFGAYSFTSVLTDKSPKVAPYLKAVKVGWQVGIPTLATAVLFPPAAPFVLAWQALNADWEQFVKRNPLEDIPEFTKNEKTGQWDPTLKWKREDDIRQYGEFKGSKDSTGRWKRGGDRIGWNDIDQKTHLRLLTTNDKLFRTASDFFTLRGWYRTFVTGETLRDRAFSSSKYTLNDYRKRIHNRIYFDYDPKNPAKKLAFLKPNFREAGWEHVGFHKGPNSNIYERVIKLSDGDLRVRLYQDTKGVWRLSDKATINTASNKFWQGAYNVQQFGKTVVSRFGIPAALAVVLPNPITYAYLGYSAFRGLGEMAEPLKWWGWKKNSLAVLVGGKLSNNIFLALELNGKSFFRRFSRGLFSVLSPFDRDVGILRGVLAWRDAQWAKFLSEHTRIGKILELAERIPFAGALFKSGGFLLGGIKWIVSPGQAIKDALWDFSKWVAWKGFRFAFGHAIRKWIMRPLTRILLGWAKSLPAGSLRGRFVRWLLGKSFGAFRPPSIKSPGFLGKIFSPISDVIKQLISRLIRAIIRFIVRLVVELVKKVVQVVVEGLKTILGISTIPVWLPVLIGVVIIFAFILLIALLLVFIVMAFLSSMAPPSPYQSGPESAFLAIHKEVLNPKTNGALFAAGDTIEYSIRYKIKKKITGAVEFEDIFLYAGSEGGVIRNFFDPDSLSCRTPANMTANSLNPDPVGPPGSWKSLIGTVPGPADPPDWQDVVCQAKVAATYTGGTLINHAVIKAKSAADNKEVSASQFLYVNGGSPSGWPTEHGCFFQGPNGAFTHQNQQAVDIGGNNSIGFNISNAPIYSTITGKVLRICIENTYPTTSNSGVCGGYDEGSYFGDTKGNGGFGTYVILKENNTRLSLFYAHLSGPRPSLTEGSAINKGDIVGYADTTGYSVGAHLHYAFTRNSGAGMNQPFIPYYVPACSSTSPDPTCTDAFKSIGEPGRVCF